MDQKLTVIGRDKISQRQKRVAEFDPGVPLALAQHEGFAVSVAKGSTQHAAYVEHYPHAGKWKPNSIDRQASVLAATPKVKQRIQYLKKISTSEKIVQFIEGQEVLSEIVRGRFSDFGEASPTGFIPNIGPENVHSAALEEVTSRFDVKGEGDGKKESVVEKIKLRDPVRALELLWKAQGHLDKDKTLHVEGEITLCAMLKQVEGQTRGLPRDRGEKLAAGVSVKLIGGQTAKGTET